MSCGSAIGYVKSYIISSFCLSIINISLKAKPCYTLFFIFKYLIDDKRTHTNSHATTTIKMENYKVLSEYHKCVLPSLT